LFTVVAGVLRLGWVADLLSRPVITGFLAGISLHIVLSQAPAVLGLPESSGDVYGRLASLWRQASLFSPASAAISLGVFAVILGSEKLSPRIPGALIALVGSTLATGLFDLERHGVAVLGLVPGGLPHLGFPRLVFDDMLPLVGLALVVSLVVMVQTAATSRSFSGVDGDPDIDRDYVGLGAANALAGLFGAFPVNASPPRTAVVAETGGRSQYASLTAALAVLLLAAFGTRFLAHLPAAALAGVLLFVAQRIFHIGDFAQILRQAPSEFALAVLTTGLIVALPIQTGVAIGIFLSLAYGVFTITRARVIPFDRMPGQTVWWPISPGHPGETESGVLVMGFQAPLSFLNVYDFRRGLMEAIARGEGEARLMVLEASSMVEIDFTASAILIGVIAQARKAGMDFAVARLESVRAQAAFDRLGVTAALGEGHQFPSVEAAIRTLRREAS
jgi:MFS superfamily sulfate permease-like transporter